MTDGRSGGGGGNESPGWKMCAIVVVLTPADSESPVKSDRARGREQLVGPGEVLCRLPTTSPADRFSVQAKGCVVRRGGGERTGSSPSTPWELTRASGGDGAELLHHAD